MNALKALAVLSLVLVLSTPLRADPHDNDVIYLLDLPGGPIPDMGANSFAVTIGTTPYDPENCGGDCDFVLPGVDVQGIAQIELILKVDHVDNYHLAFTLAHESSVDTFEERLLIDQVGGSSDGFNVVLFDGAAEEIGSVYTDDERIIGTYYPAPENLTEFYDHAVMGTWTLSAFDLEQDQFGTVQEWGLRITYGDGILSDVDTCPDTYNPDQTDSDGDGFGDACDLCPGAQDTDNDGDGVTDCVDNCPEVSNPPEEYLLGDSDGDCAIGTYVDMDGDFWQVDFDCDGVGDACEGLVPGDVDGDGDVDIQDLAALLGAYGKCTGEPGYNPAADFNGDGCISLSDLATLLGNYGT